MREQRDYQIEDLQFKIVYSRRRTIGISVLPDSSVIVRVPYLTSLKTISRIVTDKYDWVLKHRDNYRSLDNTSLKNTYKSGEMHLYHGHEYILKIEYSTKPYFRTEEPFLLIGTDKTEDSVTIKKLMYKGFREEAASYFPALMTKVLNDHQDQGFRPAGLIIRTMKRRWGSCSNKGMITLSTELIKLSDLYIEYVISHELCHLKHHNHGQNYYKLLSEVYPDWKAARKELRKYIQ